MRRKIVQWLTLLLSNSYIPGFVNGKIFKGQTKALCVPGLNCYSCPGAVGSCPIGSLQAVIGSAKYQFSFYVTGLLLLFGVVFGRFICGWLCPFGLIQELIHKIPVPKIRKPPQFPKYLKYAVLLIFVIILPMVMTNKYGMSDPWFCEYICPAGTLTAGLPLIGLNPNLRSALGPLFVLKLSIALIVVVGSAVVYRFFCRYLCPLGAIYAMFNKFSIYKLSCDSDKCVNCKGCEKSCKMNVDPSRNSADAECIRCGDCVRACPHSALKAGFRL